MLKAAWLSLIALCLAVAGCPSAQSPTSAGSKPAQTGGGVQAATSPAGAVVNWLTALEEEDKGLLMASMDVAPEHREFVAGEMDGIIALAAFTREMVEAYGPDALKDQFFNRPMPRVKDVAAHLSVEQSGDTAKVKLPGPDPPMTVVKKEGRWLVALPPNEIPPADKRAARVKEAQRFAKAFAAIRPLIGKPGSTPTSISESYAKELEKGSSN